MYLDDLMGMKCIDLDIRRNGEALSFTDLGPKTLAKRRWDLEADLPELGTHALALRNCLIIAPSLRISILNVGVRRSICKSHIRRRSTSIETSNFTV